METLLFHVRQSKRPAQSLAVPVQLFRSRVPEVRQSRSIRRPNGQTRTKIAYVPRPNQASEPTIA